MTHYNHNDVKIRNSGYGDVERMQDRLRESDRMEVSAAMGFTGPSALQYSFAKSSTCLTVLYQDQPVAMFGVMPDKDMQNVGSVWFLATDDLKKMWLTFLKLSRSSVQELLAVRPVLFNYVDARNESSIQWLRWCGAIMSEPKPYGLLGLPFRFFTFERARPEKVNGGLLLSAHPAR